MNSDLSYKLLKYLVQGAIIYLLFKYVPKEPMNDKDIIIITSIVILSCVVLENINSLYFNYDNKPTLPLAPTEESKCTSQCAMPKQQPKSESEEHKEHLENVSAIDTNSLSSAISSTGSIATSLVSSMPSSSPKTESINTNSETKEHKTNCDPVHTNPNSKKSHYDDLHMTRNEDGSYTIKPMRNPQTEAVGSRAEDGTLNDEMSYNYRDYNTLHVDPNEGSFETGYSILPPKDWYPVPPHPPVCVSEKVCPVCPVYTEGTNLALKEWNESRRITPPDEINVNVIREKLNSGR